MFNIKQFSSGEYDIQLLEKLNQNSIEIEWDWFANKDIMIPLLKADAIKRNYCNKNLILKANYLPYQRQDRIFTHGNGVPAQLIVDVLLTKFNSINTMGNHCAINNINNYKIKLNIKSDLVPVFPDQNACNHFNNNIASLEKYIILKKERHNNELSIKETIVIGNITRTDKFIICDDICAGGRTFINAANFLKMNYPMNSISLMIYHGFFDHGCEQLIKSGINEFIIINPNSFYYLQNIIEPQIFNIHFKEYANV